MKIVKKSSDITRKQIELVIRFIKVHPEVKVGSFQRYIATPKQTLVDF